MKKMKKKKKNNKNANKSRREKVMDEGVACIYGESGE